MLRRYLALSITILLVACQARTEMSQAHTSAIADSVRELSNSVFAAGKKADPEGTFRHFSSGSDAAHLNDGVRFTKDSLLAVYGEIFASLDSQQVEFKQVTVTVLGPDAAVWSANGHFKAFSKKGNVAESDAAWTLVWMRRDGQWTLIHSHQSLPRPLGS